MNRNFCYASSTGNHDVKQEVAETSTRDVTTKPGTKRRQDTTTDGTFAVKRARLDSVGLPALVPQQTHLAAPGARASRGPSRPWPGIIYGPQRVAGETTAGSSGGAQSNQPTGDHTSAQASTLATVDVFNPDYRRKNLEGNNIYIRHPDEPLPPYLQEEANRLCSKQPSPRLLTEDTLEAVSDMMELESGCTEDEVAYLLNKHVLLDPSSDDDEVYRQPDYHMARSFGTAMPPRLVPLNPATTDRVSAPRPYQQYGYSAKRDGCLLPHEYLALAALDILRADVSDETIHQIRFPFLTVEIRATHGTRRGSLWAAANECAAAAAVCLNALRELNDELRNNPRFENYQIQDMVYSIAVDNNVARLYVAWIGDDMNYNLQEIGVFLLSRPRELDGFRETMQRIFHWGAGHRFKRTRDALYLFSMECQSNIPLSLLAPLREVAGMIKASPPPSMQQRPPPPPLCRLQRKCKPKEPTGEETGSGSAAATAGSIFQRLPAANAALTRVDNSSSSSIAIASSSGSGSSSGYGNIARAKEEDYDGDDIIITSWRSLNSTTNNISPNQALQVNKGKGKEIFLSRIDTL